MNALTETRPAAAAAPAPTAGGFTGTALMDPAKFDHMVRVGRMLGMSPLVPKHLREGGPDAATANGVLVLNMAERLGEDPLTVAQNIYFVNGSPGWNATYMISKANQHGVFLNPIDWEISGAGDDLKVTAYGVLSATDKRVEVSASMEMAKAEGWTRNSKYKSMPEQMLRYRSATMLIRLYCPEVMVGVPSVVELDDSQFRDVTPASERANYQEAEILSALPDVPSEPKETKAKPAAQKVDRTPPKPAEKPAAAAEETPDDQIDPETGEVLDGPAAASGTSYEQHAALQKAILGDLENGAPPEGTLKFYAEQLEAMAKDAPELHAEVMEAAEQA